MLIDFVLVQFNSILDDYTCSPFLDGGASSDPGKKRKATENPVPKAPPSKKAASTVKREIVKIDPTVMTKVAKTDSSFFTQPKKKALPSFKKVPPAKKDDVSQPSNFDPFQEALNAMTRGSTVNSGTPTPSTTTVGTPTGSMSTPPPGGVESFDMVIDGPQRPVDPLRRKKSVTFRPDSELEAIRWIERADYGGDDDATEVCGVMTSAPGLFAQCVVFCGFGSHCTAWGMPGHLIGMKAVPFIHRCFEKLWIGTTHLVSPKLYNAV